MDKLRLLLFVVILGCVVAQSFARSIDDLNVRNKRQAEDKSGKKKGKGGGGEGGGGSATGGAEAFRADPENTKSHLEQGQKNMDGVQGIIDKHFAKKKKEGDEISAHGERTHKEAEGTQARFEQGHYDDMYQGFKYAENSMMHAVYETARDSSKESGNSGPPASPKDDKVKGNKPSDNKPPGNKPSDKKNSKAKEEAPPPPPEEEPAQDDEEEEEAGDGQVDESDEEI